MYKANKRYSLSSRELAGLVVAILVVGAVFYHYVEGLSVLDALYFSVTTLTTVGFGDISPQTAAGKIFTILYILGGISLMLAFLNLMAKRIVWRMTSMGEQAAPVKTPPRENETKD